ncbi:MAG: SDR family oxidoreductase [Halomonadaceae bacterium]|nr:MAG: SDR family oxidoreductase [Halomonadaceae bacterium]
MRKTILITGASSGLGAGMAREFAAMGRNLALCARRMDRLEALREELLGINPAIQVAIRSLDVNDYPAITQVFEGFCEDLGELDRIVINAGVGKGQPLGTGRFDANRQTAETNFVGALAQMEAAMTILRRQNHGHLVTVSSVTAVRGMPGNVTTYGATKAGLSSLTEGLRVELRKKKSPIKVTTLLPGYIRTELNEKVKNTPFIVDAKTGCKAMVRAMEKEPARAYVPGWPWTPIAWVMGKLPEAALAKIF